MTFTSLPISLPTDLRAPAAREQRDSINIIEHALEQQDSGRSNFDVYRSLIEIASHAEPPTRYASLIGSLYEALQQPNQAEEWYRRSASRARANARDIKHLASFLIRQKRYSDAASVLHHAIFSDSSYASDGALLVMLDRVKTATGQEGASYFLAAVHVDPTREQSWEAITTHSGTSSRLNRWPEIIPQPPDRAAFEEILHLGSPRTWSTETTENKYALYLRYSNLLEGSGQVLPAMNFRRAAAKATIVAGMRLLRAEHAEGAQRMFDLALAALPLVDIPYPFQVTLLRDLSLTYTQAGMPMRALAAIEQVFDICNDVHSTGQNCPIEASMRSAFDYRLGWAKKHMAPWGPWTCLPADVELHILYLGWTLRETLTYVSFDPATLLPRFADGHDFVGPAIQQDAATRRLIPGGAAPYGSVSPSEDYATLLTIDDAEKNRIQGDYANGKFELAVKLFLQKISFNLQIGMLPHQDLSTIEPLGVRVADLQNAIRRAPHDSVPESTAVAFQVGALAVSLLGRIADEVVKRGGCDNGALRRRLDSVTLLGEVEFTLGAYDEVLDLNSEERNVVAQILTQESPTDPAIEEYEQSVVGKLAQVELQMDHFADALQSSKKALAIARVLYKSSSTPSRGFRLIRALNNLAFSMSPNGAGRERRKVLLLEAMELISTHSESSALQESERVELRKARERIVGALRTGGM